MSRGIDLNNPLDLEINPQFTWQGQIPTTDPKGVLCKFDLPVNGIRAGARNLRNQQLLHGLKNWTDIITKYAPPSENDTEAYITAVCKGTGVSPWDTINLSDPTFLANSVKCVIVQEQGMNPYSDALINQAIANELGITTGANT
jgi:hypothetical protein